MSTIGGEGGIRRTGEPGPGVLADAMAQAAELARRLAVMLDEANARGPQETARLLEELRHLPAEAQKAFLAEAAGSSRGGPKEWAELVRERIARAFPEGASGGGRSGRRWSRWREGRRGRWAGARWRGR